MSTHQCPGPLCTHDDVPANMLACSGHWFQVPSALRRAVYAAWDHGRGQGTKGHRDAMVAAIGAMRAFKKDLAAAEAELQLGPVTELPPQNPPPAK